MREDTKSFLNFLFGGIVSVLGCSAVHWYFLKYDAMEMPTIMLVAAFEALILGMVCAVKNFSLHLFFKKIEEEND